MKTHFLSVTDFSALEIYKLFSFTKKLKHEWKVNKKHSIHLNNKTLAMIFEKPSLRTRVSFEAGMTQLGGHAIYLGPSDIGMGKRETVSDIAKVVSSMCDIIMARTFSHQSIIDLADASHVPVINGLSDIEHPCQALADLFTVWEVKKELQGLSIVYLGDGENNVAHSLALISSVLGMHFTCISPKGYEMQPSILQKAQQISTLSQTNIIMTNFIDMAKGADVVVTDTWVSMGDEAEKAKRHIDLSQYQVTAKIMKSANPKAIFMHCLPAYRGNEVEDVVIDGPQSFVFQEAENRMHVQKALIITLLDQYENT